jgi:hypothetical protein
MPTLPGQNGALALKAKTKAPNKGRGKGSGRGGKQKPPLHLSNAEPARAANKYDQQVSNLENDLQQADMCSSMDAA